MHNQVQVLPTLLLIFFEANDQTGFFHRERSAFAKAAGRLHLGRSVLAGGLSTTSEERMKEGYPSYPRHPSHSFSYASTRHSTGPKGTTFGLSMRVKVAVDGKGVCVLTKRVTGPFPGSQGSSQPSGVAVADHWRRPTPKSPTACL